MANIFNHPKSNLTMDQIRSELRKITDVEGGTGFLYWFIEYCYVEHPAGAKFMKNESFKWQRDAAVDFLSTRYIISKKRRQVGYSTFVGAYCLYRALFFDSQIINIVSLKLSDSTTFLRRLKFIYDHLPLWMKQSKTEDMKTSITFAHNNSKITSLPLTPNPARGETLALLVLDEFADMDGAKDVLGAGVPALAAGAQLPWTNRSIPSQLFIISTFPDSPTNNEYVRILNDARDGKNKSYAVVDVTVEDIPYYQDPDWIEEQRLLLGPRKFLTQILGEEPLDSENTLLSVACLERLNALAPIRQDFLLPDDIDKEGFYKDLNAMTKMKDEYDESYHYIKGLWIWNNPEEDHEYVITSDVAGGKGGNFSAAIVVDMDTMEQVAEYSSNRIDTEQYKKVLQVIANYYNKAKLSVENNSMGLSICEYFATTISYENFYFHQRNRSQFDAGFPMSATTRGPSIAYMQTIVAGEEIKLKSQRLIGQLRNFGYTKTGRISAMGQGHDDLVMALCQMAYLFNIGWAISSKKILNDKPLGFLGDGNLTDPIPEDPLRPRNKIYKYWEAMFDAYNLTDNQKEALAMMSETGCSVDPRDMEEFLRNNA